MYSPVCLFTYSRLNETILTIDALKNNFLASKSDLIIFSDGPKNNRSEKEVKNVRDYLKGISGFKSIVIYESPINKGLAKSIIEGVTQVISIYGSVIVLEDDLITSKNFLNYMNQSLDFYKNNEKVYSISGYTPPIKSFIDDVYFTKRASSWGWATWKNRWLEIDWELERYRHVISSKDFKNNFNKMGSDMFKMLQDQLSGKINSWAIRWCLHQFVNDSFTVFPTKSKVQNIGTGLNATHTKDSFNRFYTPLDISLNSKFILKSDVSINSMYLEQFLKASSVSTRIKYKFLNFFKI